MSIKRFCLFLSLFLLLVWFVGYVLFFISIPHSVADDSVKTDAIVVLTGDKGRLQEGLELLRKDAAKYLFISGVSHKVDFDTLAKNLPQMKNRAGFVVLGYQATNTMENALETAQWIKDNKQKSIRLVTSHYHMTRSLQEFEKALPKETVIIPHPVMSKKFNFRTFKITMSEYHKFLYSWVRYAVS